MRTDIKSNLIEFALDSVQKHKSVVVFTKDPSTVLATLEDRIGKRGSKCRAFLEQTGIEIEDGERVIQALHLGDKSMSFQPTQIILDIPVSVCTQMEADLLWKWVCEVIGFAKEMNSVVAIQTCGNYLQWSV